MTRKEKLIRRLKSKPKDFTWDETESLLAGLGFNKVKTGKTGGSRRRFIDSNNVVITLHKPHPGNILKKYQHGDYRCGNKFRLSRHQIEQIIEILSAEGLI